MPPAKAAPPMSLLDAVGSTTLVPLRRVVPPGCASVLVKLEWENPTGSMKDRMAQAVIARAEEDGRLQPGGTVVEYTGGSTGASLALVCAAKGYRIRIVTSDAFSKEKLDQMAALGAELTLVPSEGGGTTKKLILDMVEAARELSREPSALGALADRRCRSGADRRGEGDGEAAGARGGPLRGHVFRRQRDRRDPRGTACRPRRDGGHPDGGLGTQVPEHGRLQEKLS